MIRAVYILIDGGICIYSRAYDKALADPLLISSFISAISQFSREAMGNDLRGIEAEGRFVYILDSDRIVVSVVVDHPDDISANMIEYIALNFLGKYSNKLGGDTGDPDLFTGFDKVLDKVIPIHLIREDKIDPKEPLDALTLIEIPSDLREIAMVLIREHSVTAQQIADELKMKEEKAIERLEKIVELGKAGRRETRTGSVYFV